MNKLQTIERYRKLDSATIFGGIRAVLIAKTKNEYNAASGYEKTFMRGVNNQTMGKMLVGFARTLRMVPPRLDIINEKPAGENSPEFEAMSSCTEENVLVIDAMRFHHASVGGDVKFLNLYMNKAEGVVTEGSIRDLNEVKKSIRESFKCRGVKIIEVKTSISKNISAHKHMSEKVKSALI